MTADGTLNSAVGGRFYLDVAPQPTAARPVEYPLVIYRFLSSQDDVPGSDGARIFDLPLYLIEAVGETRSILSLQTIADRIDAVLHHARGGTADVRIHWCRRERPSMRTVVDNGVMRRALGGEYRVAASIDPNP